jgi:hypothetical protein
MDTQIRAYITWNEDAIWENILLKRRRENTLWREDVETTAEKIEQVASNP